MFKRTLLCGLVLAVTGVGAMANATTTDKKTPQDSATSTESKTSNASASDSASRSLIMKAILVLHGGKVLQTNQVTGSDSNPECVKCH